LFFVAITFFLIESNLRHDIEVVFAVVVLVLFQSTGEIEHFLNV
jgi:hypothetical protein